MLVSGEPMDPAAPFQIFRPEAVNYHTQPRPPATAGTIAEATQCSRLWFIVGGALAAAIASLSIPVPLGAVTEPVLRMAWRFIVALLP